MDICPCNICPGDICPYWQYLSCYWLNFDQILMVGSRDLLEHISTVKVTHFKECSKIFAKKFCQKKNLAQKKFPKRILQKNFTQKDFCPKRFLSKKVHPKNNVLLKQLPVKILPTIFFAKKIFAYILNLILNSNIEPQY